MAALQGLLGSMNRFRNSTHSRYFRTFVAVTVVTSFDFLHPRRGGSEWVQKIQMGQHNNAEFVQDELISSVTLDNLGRLHSPSRWEMELTLRRKSAIETTRRCASQTKSNQHFAARSSSTIIDELVSIAPLIRIFRLRRKPLNNPMLGDACGNNRRAWRSGPVGIATSS